MTEPNSLNLKFRIPVSTVLLHDDDDSTWVEIKRLACEALDDLRASGNRDGWTKYGENDIHFPIPVVVYGDTRSFDTIGGVSAEDFADKVHAALLRKQQTISLGFKCDCRCHS